MCRQVDSVKISFWHSKRGVWKIDENDYARLAPGGLEKLYNNVLGRDPDSGGYDWWVDQSTNNPEKIWDKVMADFSEGTENQANVLELIGNGVQYDLWVA